MDICSSCYGSLSLVFVDANDSAVVIASGNVNGSKARRCDNKLSEYKTQLTTENGKIYHTHPSKFDGYDTIEQMVTESC